MLSIPPDIPVYVYIKRELKNQIEAGELPEGARIPSEHELAKRYGVSRNPTRQALRDLEFEGYITRSPGRGSFVAPLANHQRVLRINNWRTVAIACPDLEYRYTRSVVQGFVQQAAESGLHPMVYFMRLSNSSEFEFLADLRNSGIEGMVFWLQHACDRTIDLLRRFQCSGFPFVLIDRYVRSVDADFVVSNNTDLCWRLTRGLVERGHRQIGFITSELDNTTNEDRYAGYRKALREAEVEFTQDWIGIVQPTGHSFTSVLSGIMAHRRRPTAFLATNDIVAEKLVDTLRELGYGIPADVVIAAVDDSGLSSAMKTPMLTGCQAGLEMGRESAAILLARIADPKLPLQHVFLRATVNGDASAREAMPQEDNLLV